MNENAGSDAAPGSPAVLISEGDAFLIMHLWELYPGLGRELSDAVRAFRKYQVTPAMLHDGSWSELCRVQVCPRIVAIVAQEIRRMEGIADALEAERSPTKPRISQPSNPQVSWTLSAGL
jgi:hypothetical protein